MRKLLKILSFVLVMLQASVTFLCPVMGSPSTNIYVYPSQSAVGVGQTFTIDIRISNVIDLYGWEFKLSWTPNLLDVIDVTEGPFLNQSGNTFFWPKINNTVGYILVDCTLLGEVPGVNGNGTLAYVEFYAEKQGGSDLDLYDTKLINSAEQTILHTHTDGIVTISSPVGGVIIPINKLELLAPWIGLTSTTIFALTTIFAFARRRRKKR